MTADFERYKSMLVEYALGTISAQERDLLLAQLDQHAELRAELDQLSDRVGELSEAVPAPALDGAAVWERVASRIGTAEGDSEPAEAQEPITQAWKQWTPSEGYLPADEARWEPTAIDGIEARRLFVSPDRDQATMLIRMAPGTRFPAHRHAGTEQCFVVAGDLHVGERKMTAGDFEVVEQSSVHPEQWTEEGCTLLISCSMHDELL